jgi:hypothetical protein
MKINFFCTMAFALFCLSFSSIFAGEIMKGDTAKIPGWEWVNVMNPDPVRQNFSGSAKYLGYGETCGIEMGGTVKVVGIDGDRVLLVYAAPGNPIGTPCPSGVMFFMSKENFSKMTAQYKMVCQSRDAKKDLVKKLLKN